VLAIPALGSHCVRFGRHCAHNRRRIWRLVLAPKTENNLLAKKKEVLKE